MMSMIFIFDFCKYRNFFDVLLFYTELWYFAASNRLKYICYLSNYLPVIFSMSLMDI